MKYVKWFFVVLIISSLTSFIEKDQPAGGLKVGDMAPDVHLWPLEAEQADATLSEKRGHKVLLSFWASYDAMSRLQNANLNYVLSQVDAENVEMVSVSLDQAASVCHEAIRMDQIDKRRCYMGQGGENSGVYRTYDLAKGFSNYLIDESGVIIAKNISASEILSYLN